MKDIRANGKNALINEIQGNHKLKSLLGSRAFYPTIDNCFDFTQEQYDECISEFMKGE